MSELIVPDEYKKVEGSEPFDFKEYVERHNKELYFNQSVLDGCYKDTSTGELLIRICLLDKSKNPVGWTYIKVTTIERMIKNSRRDFKFQEKRKKGKIGIK